MVRAFPTLTAWAADKNLDDASEILHALGLRWPDSDDGVDGGPTWVSEELWIGSGARFALLFCLDVWNTSARPLLPPHLREWSIVTAYASWDRAHQAVVRSYFHAPIYP